MGDQAADVFVSYKAEDRARLKPLVDALEAEGFTVWWDAHIGGGTNWRRDIEEHLDAAKCVLVAWTKRSVGPDGEFVRDEAGQARRRGTYLPVRFDTVELPLGFREVQAISLKGWRGSRSDPRFRALADAVRNHLPGGLSSHPQAFVHDRQVSRRALIAGGAVTAVTVAGVGVWEFLKPSAASAADSIAVLPFENLSGDPSQAYFSDGIAEEIRGALARIAGLKVAGRTSSEAVRKDDAETAAKRLAVGNILTGSVRQSPSTIRITAELIDGRTGLDKWSQNYDRNPGDTIKIQTDIAENVATALSTALGRVARAAIGIGGTGNASAQKLYLQANAQLRTDDSEKSVRNIIGLLDSAIALDPRFAKAFALKAFSLSNLNGYYTAAGGRFEPGYVEAAAVARQGIALAPAFAGGHFALAAILLNQLDVGRAAAEFDKAHALAGADPDDLLIYGGFLRALGKSDEALDLARQAEARDPLNPGAYSKEGRALVTSYRYAEAITAFRKALALAPQRQVDRAFLGTSLMDVGRSDEALAEFRKLPADYLFRLIGEAMLFARQGNREASDAALQRAQQLFGDAANYQYADVFARRGEKDRAFAALERAWKFRDPGLASMKGDVWLDPLRLDPRYTALLRRMNFPST